MDVVNLKGFPVRLKDDLPAKGIKAEDFYFVKSDLNEGSLYDIDAEVKLLLSVPSMDTGIGVLIGKKINKIIAGKKVHALLISKDLPFAIKRVFEKEKIEHFHIASDFRYGDYGEDFGAEMLEGALRGLLANTILILNKENNILYSELVQDIFAEPNYDAIEKALEEALN